MTTLQADPSKVEDGIRSRGPEVASMADRGGHGLGFSARRRYRIVVAGPVSGWLATAFEGMTMERAADGTTSLTGEVRDQSHLYDLLATTFRNGLDLISLQQLPPASR